MDVRFYCLFLEKPHVPLVMEGMSHYPDWKRDGEGEVFRGTHYLVLSRKKEGMKDVRTLMDEVKG